MGKLIARAGAYGRLLLHNPSGFHQRILGNVVVRRIVGPERAVRFAFNAAGTSSDKVIETALCSALNAMPFSAERVISNYCQGMVLLGVDVHGGLRWHSFPERCVITPERAHIPRRIKQYMRHNDFDIRCNTRFEQVVRACQREKWTWINEPLIEIYVKLSSMGHALSVEAYRNEQLVGGVWGLTVGTTFAPMSIFHRLERAGTIAMGTVVQRLAEGEFTMVECGGVTRPHLAQFGAYGVRREEFIEKVVRGLNGVRLGGLASDIVRSQV
jgi:leucyl/phenylalanyl-tRNA--protein transferase